MNQCKSGNFKEKIIVKIIFKKRKTIFGVLLKAIINQNEGTAENSLLHKKEERKERKKIP